MCFVAGMEDCARENRVFREWAHTWAKRVIAQNAIRELQPRPGHSHSFALVPTAFSRKNGSGKHFDVDAVLGLADFERFAFVLCVLERYREHECALLLGCSASEVREARTQAIEELAKFRPGVYDVYGDRERGGWAEALKA
jgi:DNA-directed RNA polymerase specialized sigma24 family protein